VLDHGTRELSAIDCTTARRQVLATHLPVGAAGPMDFPGGLAVGRDGTMYIAADGEGSLYTLRKG